MGRAKAITMQTSVKTYTAEIYVGLKEGYNGPVRPISDVIKVVREYADKVGLGVTVTPTTFVYTNGGEPGAIIGLINYPRFSSTPVAIRSKAKEIGRLLLAELKQERLTIVCTDVTIMLGREDG